MNWEIFRGGLFRKLWIWNGMRRYLQIHTLSLLFVVAFRCTTAVPHKFESISTVYIITEKTSNLISDDMRNCYYSNLTPTSNRLGTFLIIFVWSRFGLFVVTVTNPWNMEECKIGIHNVGLSSSQCWNITFSMVSISLDKPSRILDPFILLSEQP